MELAFAGLHQLCAPMLDRLDRLPGPQRDALATAFGLSAGTAPDRFLVGLAVLSLLAEVAEEQPLVCLVDDAQWLDRASAQTLAFVARRLLAERVAMVFAVREPERRPRARRACRSSSVAGLSDGDARALLDSVVTGPAGRAGAGPDRRRDRGNPLALLELPRGLTPAELAGGFGLPDARPLASRIEQSFLRRIAALPRRDAAAAAGRGGRAGRRSCLVWRAAERLGIGGRGRDSGRGRGADRARRAGAVPSSAGALGGLSRGAAERAAGSASRAGRGDRSRRRSRPAGLASRPRGGRPDEAWPPSSSARPVGRRRAAGWRRRRRSSKRAAS